MSRRRSSIGIVTNGDILGEIDHLRQSLRLAKAVEMYDSRGLSDESPRLERRLVELAQQAAEGAMTVTVEALPAAEFDEIARRNPPSAAQFEAWKKQAEVFPMAEMPEYDPATMAPELLAACLVEPEWSDEWWASQSRGVQNQIWNLAIRTQVSGADLNFFNAGIDTTDGIGGLLTTAQNGASPSPSS